MIWSLLSMVVNLSLLDSRRVAPSKKINSYQQNCITQTYELDHSNCERNWNFWASENWFIYDETCYYKTWNMEIKIRKFVGIDYESCKYRRVNL